MKGERYFVVFTPPGDDWEAVTEYKCQLVAENDIAALDEVAANFGYIALRIHTETPRGNVVRVVRDFEAD
jgi:hypothetical protein